MKFKQISEERYAAQRTIGNLLTFFEEKHHMVIGHRAFDLRAGFVCYFAGKEIEEIEDQNGTFYVMLDARKKELTEENLNDIYVFNLKRVF